MINGNSINMFLNELGADKPISVIEEEFVQDLLIDFNEALQNLTSILEHPNISKGEDTMQKKRIMAAFAKVYLTENTNS